MFERILVPLDGSEVAETILPYVEDLETAEPLIPHALCIIWGFPSSQDRKESHPTLKLFPAKS